MDEDCEAVNIETKTGAKLLGKEIRCSLYAGFPLYILFQRLYYVIVVFLNVKYFEFFIVIVFPRNLVSLNSECWG